MKRPEQRFSDPLTDAEKRHFVEHGYLHVASAVPTPLARRARRAINHSLGAGIDKRDVTRMNARSFCEELVENPRLLRLATNPGVWSHVRALLGDRRVERPRECQIALRFPRPEGTARTLDPPHLDGYHTPDNGLPDDGVVYGFTLLLGVMLSDVDRPMSGNFTVWPGTHLKLERYFRDHGVNSLEQGDVTTSGIRLPRPVPIMGEVGRYCSRPLSTRPRRVAEPVRRHSLYVLLPALGAWIGESPRRVDAGHLARLAGAQRFHRARLGLRGTRAAQAGIGLRIPSDDAGFREGVCFPDGRGHARCYRLPSATKQRSVEGQRQGRSNRTRRGRRAHNAVDARASDRTLTALPRCTGLIPCGRQEGRDNGGLQASDRPPGGAHAGWNRRAVAAGRGASDPRRPDIRDCASRRAGGAC